MPKHRYVDPDVKYGQLVSAITKAIGRELTTEEDRQVKWLSQCEYVTSGVFLELFKATVK